MKSFLNFIGLSVVALALAGCAHPINITPDVAKIEMEPGAKKIDKSVAYFIAPAKKELKVTTPGGGGDKVSYQPYKELEIGIYKVLSNVFTKVTVLGSETDEAIAKNSVRLVLTPSVLTDSSSPSAFTWPPTKFHVNLSCAVTDASGKTLTTISAVGDGAAEFDEFKADLSLSARRASLDALSNFQRELLKSKVIRD